MAADTGVSQAVTELLKEVNKAQSEMQKVEPKKEPTAAFSQVIESHAAVHQTLPAVEAQKATDILLSVSRMNSMQREKLASTQGLAYQTTTRVGTTAKKEKSALVKMLEGFVSGQDKMTAVMNRALSGEQLGPSDLLRMQSTVYLYTQELDLTTKVVDKGTSSVKQTLQTQV